MTSGSDAMNGKRRGIVARIVVVFVQKHRGGRDVASPVSGRVSGSEREKRREEERLKRKGERVSE